MSPIRRNPNLCFFFGCCRIKNQTAIMIEALFLVQLLYALGADFLNGTGSTFIGLIQQQNTFAYRFVKTTEQVHYFGTGSSAGKCNIMGY